MSESKILNKKECVVAIQNIVNTRKGKKVLTYSEALEVYDDLVNALVSEVTMGNTVAVSGIGKFGTKLVAAHQARNPKTGGMVDVPEKRKLVFKPFPSFTSAVS